MVGVFQDIENYDFKEMFIFVKWQCLGIRNGMVLKYFYIKFFFYMIYLKFLVYMIYLDLDKL